MELLRLDGIGAAPWEGRRLLQDIHFSLAAGEVLSVLGPNGAGKTSLLNLLCGAISPDRGSYHFLGRPFNEWDTASRARSQAVLPQQSALNFPFSVEEVVRLGRIPHASGAQQDQKIVERCLEASDTLALRQRLYTQLSGGEKQRVQLARVLAQIWRAEDAPGRLLLLDEPTSALDLAHQRLVLQQVRELAADGCGVLMILHDFNLAARYSDRCLLLAQGHQRALGSPREVLTPDLLGEVFEAPVDVLPHPEDGLPVVLPR